MCQGRKPVTPPPSPQNTHHHHHHSHQPQCVSHNDHRLTSELQCCCIQTAADISCFHSSLRPLAVLPVPVSPPFLFLLADGFRYGFEVHLREISCHCPQVGLVRFPRQRVILMCLIRSLHCVAEVRDGQKHQTLRVEGSEHLGPAWRFNWHQ